MKTCKIFSKRMIARLQDEFVRDVMPAVQRHARRRCWDRPDADDLIAEALAHAWDYYLKLRRQGRDPVHFLGAFAGQAVNRALNGKQVGNTFKRGDVMSRACLVERGIRCRTVGDRTHVLESARAREVRPSEPPDITRHRDWPAWRRRFLQSRDPRVRPRYVKFLRLAHRGHRMAEIAAAMGITHSTAVALGNTIRRSWMAFRRDPDGYLRGPRRTGPRSRFKPGAEHPRLAVGAR